MSRSFSMFLGIAVVSFGSIFAFDGENSDWVAKTDNGAKKKSADGKNGKKGVVELPPFLPSQPCPDSGRLSGAFLYLLPTVDDTYFVISADSGSGFPNGERTNNDFGCKPAFRLGAEYALCDTHRSFQAFYTYLHGVQNKKVESEHFWATVGSPDVTGNFNDTSGSASSKLNLLYHGLDVQFTQQILNSSGLYFYLEPGLEYAYLRLNQNIRYDSVVDGLAQVETKANTWGVGPQIGLGCDYNLYEGILTNSATHAFSMSAVFSGSILVGQSRNKSEDFLDGAFVLNVQDEHAWRTFSAFHARFGFNYLIDTARAGVVLGIGYEFNTYIRGLSKTIFSDDVSQSFCFTNYYNFDVQGLSISAAVSF